jgi:hypothetical protein
MSQAHKQQDPQIAVDKPTRYCPHKVLLSNKIPIMAIARSAIVESLIAELKIGWTLHSLFPILAPNHGVNAEMNISDVAMRNAGLIR